MKCFTVLQISILLTLAACGSMRPQSAGRTIASVEQCDLNESFTLVIHGGVGYVANSGQKAVMKNILMKGHRMLKDGARGIDVVQTVVEEMEHSGAFHEGGKNRIHQALKLADGSNQLTRELGLDSLRRMPASSVEEGTDKTLGAVAKDRCGDLAAGTSMGGRYNENYANNHTVAVSGSGRNEKFSRANVGTRISSILQYTERSLKSAVEESLESVKELKGDGGIISVDKAGAIYWSTTGHERMPRGSIAEDGVLHFMDLKV
jgi:isoaspartyl peptidase/L-asparaginase-like protein (Ntn-hydrolase superfamily)